MNGNVPSFISIEKDILSPYSLGKLIEWKRAFVNRFGIMSPVIVSTPYSLGKLIEWKLQQAQQAQQVQQATLPTR